MRFPHAFADGEGGHGSGAMGSNGWEGESSMGSVAAVSLDVPPSEGANGTATVLPATEEDDAGELCNQC